MPYDPDSPLAEELRQEDACRRELLRQRVQHWHPWDPERPDYYDEEDER